MRNLIAILLIVAGLIGAAGSIAYDYFSTADDVVAEITIKPLALVKPKHLKQVVAAKKPETERVMTEAEYNRIWQVVGKKCNHCGEN